MPCRGRFAGEGRGALEPLSADSPRRAGAVGDTGGDGCSSVAASGGASGETAATASAEAAGVSAALSTAAGSTAAGRGKAAIMVLVGASASARLSAGRPLCRRICAQFDAMVSSQARVWMSGCAHNGQ